MPFFIPFIIGLALTAVQSLIARAFAPKPPPQELGKRTDDISSIQSDYGIMIPEVYGGMAGADVAQNGMRVTGNIIWMTDIEEKVLKYKKNKVPITEYLYFVDLAVMFGRGPLRVVKIWAETDLIFNITYSGGATGVYDPNYPQNVPYDPYHPPDPNSPDVTAPERFSREHPYELNETYNAQLYKDTFIRIYPGNETQSVDSLIQTDINGKYGVGSTPAYLGRCYAVLENFPITKYGYIPTFTALVYNPVYQSFKAIAYDLCTRVGLDATTDFDWHCIDGANVRGYLITDRRTARNSLEILGQAYNTEFVEANGKLYAIERGSQPEQTIDLNHIGAVEGSEVSNAENDPPTKIDIRRLDETQLPWEVNVNYADPAKDHRQNTQSDIRQVTRSKAQNTVDLSTLCLTANEAKQIAIRELYRAWLEQTSYEFSLPYRYCRYKPTDVLRVTYGEISHRMRIISVEGGIPGALKFTCVRDEITVFNQIQATGNAGDGSLSQVEVPANSIMALMDIPLLSDADDANPGMYFGVSTRDPSSGRWAGADLYRDKGAGDELLAHFNSGAKQGRAASILASASATVFDRTNTVTVDLYDGTLTSAASELEVLNGRNRALLGNEIIGFLTATAVGGYARRYTLSTLLRGRRGTEAEVSTHTSNERFTMLDGAIQYLDFDLGERNIEMDYKAVTVGADLADAAVIPFTWVANGLKPYSVVMIAGSRDGSSNLTITWTRRTRIGGELADGIDVPLGEAYEKYEVDILNGAIVVRTITVTAETASYSASDQTTDFGSPQPSISIKIYQISDAVGRGFPASATV
jgi:hypothetical protein